MKILVNATTIVMGGGVQVAAAFITKSIEKDKIFLFRYLVSNAVHFNLDEKIQTDSRIKIINISPANIFKRKQIKKIIHNEELIFKPDVAFTIFGPAYLNFKCPHLVGFADPWVTHSSKIAMDILSFHQRLLMRLLIAYKKFYLNSKDYYWVEAPVASHGLQRLLGINESQIRVFPNTYSNVFLGKKKKRIRSTSKSINVVTITAPYIHKNLTIIPELSHKVKMSSKDIEFKFYVTLPSEGKEVKLFWSLVKKYKVEKSIINCGVLRISECIDLYNKSDIVFLPTLLETFSATYPEAMYMDKPILTTDLDFAREACGDAAIYFEPRSAADAAEKLYSLATDNKLCEKLIMNGNKRLKSLPTPNQKFGMLISWIQEIHKMNKSRKFY